MVSYLVRVAAAGARTESVGHPPASVPPSLPPAGPFIAPRAAELALPVDVEGVPEQPLLRAQGEEPDAADTRAPDISRSPHAGQKGDRTGTPAEPPVIPAVQRTRVPFPAEVPPAGEMGTVTAHALRPSLAHDAASAPAAQSGAPVPTPAGSGKPRQSSTPASGPAVNAAGAPSPRRSGDPLSRPLPPLPSRESLSAAPARLGDMSQAGAGDLAPALLATPRLAPRVPGLPTPAQPPTQASAQLPAHTLDAARPRRIEVQVQNQPQALPRTQVPPPPPRGAPVNGYLERFWLKP